MKRVALIAALALCTASSAHAEQNSAFACYSVWQQDPGAWSVTNTSVFAGSTAYATGYWAPFAERSIPSAEKIGPYYLTCALPAGWAVAGTYVTAGGDDVTANPDYFADARAIPGVYPVIAPG